MTYQNYFAYGSNIDRDQMSERCPGARLVGPGLLRSYRFRINSRGVATVVPDESAATWGVVWKITDEHRENLDEKEGVRFGTYSPKHVRIELSDGQVCNCLIYHAKDISPGIPRDNYLERIIWWAEKHGLPQDYIDRELRPWLEIKHNSPGEAAYHA